jgi:hypothetical protein
LGGSVTGTGSLAAEMKTAARLVNTTTFLQNLSMKEEKNKPTSNRASWRAQNGSWMLQ